MGPGSTLLRPEDVEERWLGVWRGGALAGGEDARWMGAAGVVRLVLRFVLLVEMAQAYHFEAEGEPSKRGLALQLRLQMGFDAAGCWVAAAVHLMLQLELTVKSSQEQHCEAELWREQPRQRPLAMVLHRQKETDASVCWLEGHL